MDGCGKSRPTGIRSRYLATTEVSVFFFILCTLLSNILTLSAWSPIIWTWKLTYFFWFLFSWKLTPFRDDWLVNFVPQFILQISVAVFFEFFLLCKGDLSTSSINFSMSSTIDIAVWLKTQGLCTLLQLPSNFLVASARGQTETCASYPYQQHSSCLENGSGRFRQQLFCYCNRKVGSACAVV